MPAISVLHAPRDEALGEKIATALSRDGHQSRCVGSDPLAGDLLLENGVAIVIWSKASAKLVRLHEQAYEALQRGGLIPVAIGGARAPAGFEDVPPVDLTGWGGSESDPRWRFVLEEVNLVAQRSPLEDGEIWGQAGSASPQNTPSATVDGLFAVPSHHQPIPIDPDDSNHIAPAIAGDSFEDEAAIGGFIDEAKQAFDPIGIVGSDQIDADEYQPLVAPLSAIPASQTPDFIAPASDFTMSKKKPFRFGSRFSPMAVVAGGGVGLFAMSAVAIMLAPSILSPVTQGSSQQLAANQSQPAADSQPVKTQSDFEVTSYREGAPLNTIPDDILDGSQSVDQEQPETADDIELAQVTAQELLEEPPLVNDADTDLELTVADVDGLDDLVAEVSLASVSEGDLSDAMTLDQSGEDQLAQMQVPAASLLPADVISRIHLGNYFSDCTMCPSMAALPAGSFRLGSPEGEAARQAVEGPMTDISLAKPFAMATREVTYAEWDACVADGGCQAYKPSDMGWGRRNRPVANVSYGDARAYVAWLSAKTGKAYRLPSEAEWEFAARGGSGRAFAFGDTVTPDRANYNGNYPYRGAKGEFRAKTVPVASFEPNGFGLYDMHGNVWEWTQDCWNASHVGAASDGRVRTGSCSEHVIKGGAWNTGGWRLRSAHRVSKAGTARENDVGFRVARDLD